MKILISSCLLGLECQYNGNAKWLLQLDELMEKHTLIPVCPECYGGLAIPREPAEIVDGRVISRDGKDVTEQFMRGANSALRLAKLYGAEAAILKERSPSCGYGKIYDGTFSGNIIDGNGIAAQILADAGLAIYGEGDVEELL